MSTSTATHPKSQPGADPDLEAATPSGRTLVLVAAFLAIALMLAMPLRAWFGQRAETRRLEAEIAAAQARVDALAAASEQWADAGHVAAQARSRLNMALPGEAPLIAVDLNAAASPEQPAPNTWYGRLWQSTAESAGAPEPAPDDGR